MKKLTSILCALSLLISTTSFTLPTNDDTVSSKVKSAFEKKFTAATQIKWESMSEFYVVNFKVDDQSFSAAFDEEGELICASRSITLAQLPLTVSLALQNEYEEYKVENLVVELTLNGETSYYIKAENAKRIVTIKASPSGALRIENKTKKK